MRIEKKLSKSIRFPSTSLTMPTPTSTMRRTWPSRGSPSPRVGSQSSGKIQIPESCRNFLWNTFWRVNKWKKLDLCRDVYFIFHIRKTRHLDIELKNWRRVELHLMESKIHLQGLFILRRISTLTTHDNGRVITKYPTQFII